MVGGRASKKQGCPLRPIREPCEQFNPRSRRGETRSLAFLGFSGLTYLLVLVANGLSERDFARWQVSRLIGAGDKGHESKQYESKQPSSSRYCPTT